MKLTVIIPVYNGSQHIIRCLESVFHQTFQDFQVLCFDDGSQDHSAEVIRQYAEEYPEYRLTLIRQENKGVAETRNEGIKRADTEYTAFIDQDDYIDRTYFEEYIRAMEDSRADIVCGGYVRYDTERHRVLRKVSLKEDEWAPFVVSAPWAHLYRTSFLQSNNIRYLKTAIGEDVYFSLMAYAHTDKIRTIPNTGYYWVDNPKSHSNSNQKQIRKEIDPFILLNALRRDLPETNRIRPELLQYYIYRYIVWYLLFTVRNTPAKTIEEQYGKLIQWLKDYYPGFDRNKLISLCGPVGEPFGIRLSVWGFTRMYRIGLMPGALTLLARRSSETEAREDAK